MNISAETIDQTVDAFRALLGARFERLMGAFDPKSVKGLRAYHQHAAAAHPFALWWTQLQKDVDKTKAKKAFVLGDSSVFLLDFYTRLLDAANDPLFPEMLEKLAAPNQFFSTMFEAFIYSAYRQRGLPISFIPRSKQAGVRTADFRVGEGADAVLIECKSLQDPSEEEASIWFGVCARIAKELLRQKQHWRVTLTPNRYISGRDAESVLARSKELITQGRLGPAALSEFVAWKAEVIDSTATFSRTTDFGWVEAEITVGDKGEQIVKAPAIVQVQRFFDPDETDRIQRAIEDAAGQLDGRAAGVVHIEIPFRNAHRLLDIADNAYGRTFGRLAKSHAKISCVGLVGRFVDPKTKEGRDPIASYFANIPNAKAARSIPISFPVLGAEGEDHGMGGEGTIFIEFAINEPLPDQQGRSLYSFCSHDAQRQLRLWQSYKNHFRADVVQPAFGRRTFKADLNNLAVGRFHKLALAYSATDMGAALNGQLIEPLKT